MVTTIIIWSSLFNLAHSATIDNSALWHMDALSDLKASIETERIEGPARNIILFVGDGMGVITRTLARIYKGQKEDRTGEEGKLIWEDFPYSGLIKTYNTNFQVCLSGKNLIIFKYIFFIKCL